MDGHRVVQRAGREEEGATATTRSSSSRLSSRPLVPVLHFHFPLAFPSLSPSRRTTSTALRAPLPGRFPPSDVRGRHALCFFVASLVCSSAPCPCLRAPERALRDREFAWCWHVVSQPRCFAEVRVGFQLLR
jgi:hypothetical protein